MSRDNGVAPNMTQALLDAARRIAAATDAAGIARAVEFVPHEVLGAGRFRYEPAFSSSRNPGYTTEPHADDEGVDDDDVVCSVVVSCEGVIAGRLQLAGDVADSPLARSLLDGVARLIGTSLENHSQLRELRRLNQQLQTDGYYFETLYNAAPDAIVVLNAADRIIRVNREFERLFGYTAAEVRDRPINDLIVPSDAHRDATRLTQRVAAGEAVREEGMRRRKDGSVFHADIRGAPILARGHQLAVYAIYRDITAQKETEEALRRLSTTDELTGLFNRRGFFLLAEQQRRLAIRRRAQLLLLYIDIDDFKAINDTYGHIEGDRVLADLGKLLRSCFRDSDIMARVGDEAGLLARMGGDEFVVLAIDPSDQGESILRDRVVERLLEYNTSHGRELKLSLSIGAVTVRPDPNTTIDSLLAAADNLMYRQKRDRLASE